MITFSENKIFRINFTLACFLFLCFKSYEKIDQAFIILCNYKSGLNFKNQFLFYKIINKRRH